MHYFYGCVHEQFRPSELLRHARLAEEAGFDGLTSSDHLQPWWEPGESGHAWMWLGAAGRATERCQIGPAVTVALKRYHPVLVAQGFATLEELFPGRVFVGIGSGESLNESPVGCDWPSRTDQLAALEEALTIIRRLWDGEALDTFGRFEMKQAKLHTRSERRPPLYVSAFHPGAAELAGRLGDGLWTIGDPETTPDLIETYQNACAEAGREPGEIVLQGMFSWAGTDEQALEGARVWKGAQPPEYYTDDWHDPKAMFEHAEETVSDEEFKQSGIISADPDVHAEKIRELEKLGATIVALNNCSGADPEGAIRVYREQVLPRLRSRSRVEQRT